MMELLREVKPNDVSSLSLDPVDEKTRDIAKEIIKDVAENGEIAFRKHAKRLGDLESEQQEFWYTPLQLKEAFDSLNESEQKLLERTASQIRHFAQVQMSTISNTDTVVPGGRAGQNVSPVSKAGCYAPGGNYPLPSSVLMTAITARVAGVKEVIVASPRPKPITLAAAHVAQADGLLGVGGAQVIAALAYGGVKGVGEKGNGVDVIVGPGNRWVTAAKQIVSSFVGIDMLAGPSECLVVADETADASIIAADLLAQAEHDKDATPILVTTSRQIMIDVQKEVVLQLKTLSTAETARVACEKGFCVVVPTIEDAIKISDSLAPEHLEVMTKNSKQDALAMNNYGGLFIGPRSAEVMGDYGAGPNHVLPTSGTARFNGGLSVFTYLRIRTWLELSETPTENEEKEQYQLVQDAAQLARLEGLEGHARSAEKRLLLFKSTNTQGQTNSESGPPAKRGKHA